jgi:uracil-DNA glycosylase
VTGPAAQPADRSGPAQPAQLPAGQPGSWDQLAAVVRDCTRCPELVATRTQVVVGQAPQGARLLLVGEAPGAQEDTRGVPFVGRAGALLDQMLAKAGLDRGAVAVVNVLKCRPPRNRRPAAAEIASCRPWLADQLSLVGPQLVVTLGLVAAQWALGPRTRLAAARGVIHEVAGRPVVVTYHPSAALRFGPRGVPSLALAADLAWVAGMLDGGQ